MAEFSIPEAAFTGFRVVRARPRALVSWAVFALVVSLAFGALLAATVGPVLGRLQSLGDQPRLDPAAAMALGRGMAPAYLPLLIIALTANAFLYAAMNRAVLAAADDRFGYFRAGADELRQLGLQLLAFVVFAAAYVALLLAAVLLTVLASSTAGKAAVAAVGAVAGAAVLGALVWLAVRLSLASALTFATRRVDLFGSWKLTRGRFWPILATYLLTVAMALVVYVLAFLVVAAVLGVFSAGYRMAAILRPDMSSLAAWLSPATLIQAALQAAVAALLYPVIFTPPAAIYRRLAPSPPVDVLG